MNFWKTGSSLAQSVFSSSLDPTGLAFTAALASAANLSTHSFAASGVFSLIQSDVAVAGYAFGGVLSAPTLTFGTLADIKGLNGDTRVQRLEIASHAGDVGGPVFDGSGAVTGLLLAGDDGARQLPDSVAFAADTPVLAEFLSANGIRPATSQTTEPMAPEDLTLLAGDLTVLVGCWN